LDVKGDLKGVIDDSLVRMRESVSNTWQEEKNDEKKSAHHG
jgi:hypothetical protein